VGQERFQSHFGNAPFNPSMLIKTAVLTTFAAGAAGSALINFSADSGVADTSISFDGVTGGLRTDRAITIGDDNTCTKIDGASECLSTTLANLHTVRDACVFAVVVVGSESLTTEG
jgi:hypothetical protein